MRKNRKQSNTLFTVGIVVFALVVFAMVPFVGNWVLDTFIYPSQEQTEGSTVSNQPTDPLPTQDTLPPYAEANPMVTNVPGPYDANAFVANIQDESQVSVSFAAVPDWSLEGQQLVEIILVDVYGNSTSLISSYTLDSKAPVITGAKNLEVYVGDTVSYRSGVTASDEVDESPTLSVDSTAVNLSVPGTYPVVYTATDALGNRQSVTINIIVREKPDNYVDPEIIYQKVDSILAKFIRDDMTDREKAEAVYVWTRRDVHLTYGSAPKRTDYVQTAYEFLQGRKGDCYYFFAIQKLMLERLGIPTIDLHKEKNFEGDSNHYWLLVSVDGGKSYYHFDNVWSKNLCLVTDAELDQFSSWIDSNPFNRDKSLYPATPTQKLPESALPWNNSDILTAYP